MTALPQGWAAPKLEDVCEFNPKHSSDADQSLLVSFVPMPAVSEHSGAIDGAVDRPLSEIWKGYTHFADGDVIFAKITPCMENGKAAVARGLTNGIACGSTEFHVLRSKGAVLPDYVWRFMRQDSFRRDAEAHMTGAVGQRRVPKSYLEQHEIPLPPLPEQRRIVRKLDTLSARSTTARTHLTAIEKLVERYKLSVLAALTLSSEQSNPDWKEVTLDQVRDPKASIRYGVVQPGTIKDEGVPLVRVCDLMGGRVQWSELRRVSVEIDEAYANARIQDGDILVSVVGTIGRVALVAGVTEPTNIARAVSRIRPNRKLVDPSWLFWRLNAPDAQARFDGDVREVARKTLNIGLIKETPFKLPSLDEQREIVHRIETAFAKIDRLAAEAAKALKLLGHLDQRILAKAFAGDLVPQDPTDEPAETLLARIRETAAAAPKSRRGRK